MDAQCHGMVARVLKTFVVFASLWALAYIKNGSLAFQLANFKVVAEMLSSFMVKLSKKWRISKRTTQSDCA